MEAFVSVIIIVFGILQIILFFKLWGMTNDVSKLKEYFSNFIPLPDKKAIVKSTHVEVEIIKYEYDIMKYQCYNPKSKIYEYHSKEDLILE